MTNNPAKYGGLEGYGLDIVERVPLEQVPNPENVEYLRTNENVWPPAQRLGPGDAREHPARNARTGGRRPTPGPRWRRLTTRATWGSTGVRTPIGRDADPSPAGGRGRRGEALRGSADGTGLCYRSGLQPFQRARDRTASAGALAELDRPWRRRGRQGRSPGCREHSSCRSGRWRWPEPHASTRSSVLGCNPR